MRQSDHIYPPYTFRSQRISLRWRSFAFFLEFLTVYCFSPQYCPTRSICWCQQKKLDKVDSTNFDCRFCPRIIVDGLSSGKGGAGSCSLPEIVPAFVHRSIDFSSNCGEVSGKYVVASLGEVQLASTTWLYSLADVSIRCPLAVEWCRLIPFFCGHSDRNALYSTVSGTYRDIRSIIFQMVVESWLNM